MDLQNPLPRFRMLLILAETIGSFIGEHVSTSNVSPNIIEPFETESVALRETYVAPAPGAASCVRVELLGSQLPLHLLLLLLGSLADKQPSSVVIQRL